MKAFILDRYGSPEVGRMGDAPEPEVREDDVLVEVHAAGLNVLDLKIATGQFKLILPYRLPIVLGHDVAGVVIGVGTRVERFRVGDEVYACADHGRIGTFAGTIAIREASVAIKPKTLSMEEAASIPLVALTAWQALVERAGLREGQKVLIQAGSGGVGTVAIQLAKHLGATVATTASAANFDFVRELGADLVIDYRKGDFASVLRNYDVVLDSLGGETLEKSLRVLKPGGKVIGIAGPPDAEFAKELGANIAVRLVMTLLSRGIRQKAKARNLSYSFLFVQANGQQLREFAALIDSGVIRSVLDRVFPFEGTGEALAYLGSGRARGKVVVKVR
jgi:NADPH:quinone reductase-like Zn-dependent oxidoreductase